MVATSLAWTRGDNGVNGGVNAFTAGARRLHDRRTEKGNDGEGLGLSQGAYIG
jgi:hypothetical protein